jgi:hypothetical protein
MTYRKKQDKKIVIIKTLMNTALLGETRKQFSNKIIFSAIFKLVGHKVSYFKLML